MGSLAVLLKIGLFSTNGGTSEKPFYEISSPIFNKITIKLNPKYYPGKQFVIEASGNSSKNIYIQSALLNGSSINQPWFFHDQLIKGGKLTLNMSSTPNKKWGAMETQAPPSMSN
jgi:putative alpha-1,2-mannosidase